MNGMVFAPLLAQAAKVASQAAQAVADQGASAASGFNWQTPAVVLALILSVAVGYWLAKAMRLAEFGWRFALIFFTLTSAALITGFGWPPKLGIDLKGGIILVYETADDLAPVDDTQATPDEVATKINIQDVVEGISKRLNPSGVADVVVRALGTRQIEIIIPDVVNEQVTDIKRQVSTAGFLQFRIIADPRKHDDVVRLAQASLDDFSAAGHRIRDISGKVVGEWVEVRPDRVNDALRSGDVTRSNPKTNLLEVLVAVDRHNVEGKDVRGAQPDVDRNGGWCVSFNMKADGAEKFGNLTGENLPDTLNRAEYRLGILVDRQLISAPSIKSQINSDGQITGSFTRDEVRFLSNIIKSGRLPAALKPEPISETSIDPLLGVDTIRKGAFSFAVSTSFVFLFMLVYYKFSGFVACLALLANVVLTLAIMIAFKASLTMPGLAGFVLTVGMSVDANVLIYERFRDELAHGTGMRTAIRNGFARATTTIIDSQLTTLITAIVLYTIGTDQIKGFAITLILGIITSLFTAIFCSRVLFDLVDRKRWITTLSMRQFLGQTNFDFMAMRNTAIFGSLVLIAVGIVGLVVRGDNIYDIDLRGGTSVEIMLAKPENMDAVRSKIEKRLKQELKFDVALARLSIEGRDPDTTYKIDSSITSRGELEKHLSEIFAGNLVSRQATFADPTAVVAPVETTPPAAIAPAAPNQPEPKQPESKQPAEAPPAETKAEPAKEASPDAEKGAQPNNADAPEAKSPPAEKSVGTALPSISELAFASDVALTVALLQEPAAPTAEAKTEPAPEAKTEPAPEAKTEPAPEAKTEPAPEAKTEPAPEAKTEPAPEAKTEPAPEAKTEPAPEAKTEPAATPLPSGEVPTAPGGSGNLVPEEPKGPVFASEASIHFEHKIDGAALSQFLADTQAGSPQFSKLDFRLPDWDGRSGERKSDWKVQFTPNAAEVKNFLQAVEKQVAGTPVWLSSSEVKGLVVDRMKEAAVWATIISFLGITLYVWIRFERLSYGIAAIVALVHDVLVTLGMLALSRWFAGPLGFALIEEFKINLPVVAAILTLVGYSINDTIVVFDRIREVKGRKPRLSPEIINQSVNNTLARSIITSGLTFITVLMLYALGGQPIHAFSFALVVGIIAGSYSTIFIAAPILLWLEPSDKSLAAPAAKGGNA